MMTLEKPAANSLDTDVLHGIYSDEEFTLCGLDFRGAVDDLDDDRTEITCPICLT